jgi:hypothetical protein
MANRQSREAKEEAKAEYNESQELENLQRVFQILSHQKQGALPSEKEQNQPKVSPAKLKEALGRLQYKCKRQDVEDMIWEVDEDCDGMISWEEFKAMFYRVRHDKTGWEPRRLFNVVEFMMHDKVHGRHALCRVSQEPSAPLPLSPCTRASAQAPPADRSASLHPRSQDQSGNIDMDECMEILFRRFGKDGLEARVNEFMINDKVRRAHPSRDARAREICGHNSHPSACVRRRRDRRIATRRSPSPSS